MFRHDCPLEAKSASTPRHLLLKQIWSDSLPVDMLLSTVYALVVSLPSSQLPERLMNYSAFRYVIAIKKDSFLKHEQTNLCNGDAIHLLGGRKRASLHNLYTLYASDGSCTSL
jgi:hypothetical protein